MNFEKIAKEIDQEAVEYFEKMADERKSSEVKAYNMWLKTQNPKYFQELYTSMKPMLSKAIQGASYNSNIPQSAHMAYAAQNFYDSLKTYDPAKGTLQTHIYGSVGKKAHRLNALYQNLGHMPEPRAQIVGRYIDAKEHLKNEYAREPSAAEVADFMNIGLKQVTHLEREVQKDLAFDQGTENVEMFSTDKAAEVLEFIYYELSGEEQVVYDYILGKHGKMRMLKPGSKVIDFQRIAQSMGVSESKVRGIHKKITSKLEKVK